MASNNEITLAHSSTLESDMTYATLNASVGSSNYTVFETAEAMPPIKKKISSVKQTMRQRRIEHISSTYNTYKVIISTDELSSANKTFLENLWNANYKYISRNTRATIYDDDIWSDYEEVYAEGEDYPIGYIDQIIYLPEITLNLIAVNPSE